MIEIIKYSQFLNESTLNYYPGYSDDGTSDSLGKIYEHKQKNEIPCHGGVE